MFWLSRNTFLGSYFFLIFTRRVQFGPYAVLTSASPVLPNWLTYSMRKGLQIVAQRLYLLHGSSRRGPSPPRHRTR